MVLTYFDMWNDTDVPLAYSITFRTYGTWLHGDDRGSVNRFRNEFGTDRLPKNEEWVDVNKNRMKNPPVKLEAQQRTVVERAIRQTCDFRDWNLHAINVRTNHVHSVVSIGGKKPEIALNAFKANWTRELRRLNLWLSTKSPWSDKGSKRSLWNEKSIAAAADYVINGQGDDLPKFDLD